MDEVASKLWSGAVVSGWQGRICNVLPVVEEKQMISIDFETQEPYWNLPCSYTFLQDNRAKVRDVRTSLLAVSSSIWLTSCCHSLFTNYLMIKSGTYLITRKVELHKYRLGWLFINRHETVSWDCVWVSCGCCNKWPQMWWFKDTHIYSLPLLEVRSPESVSLGQNQGVSWALFPWSP